MIFGRALKRKKEVEDKINTFLAIDIGTEYVKSVVYTHKKGEIEVIGYSRVKQKPSSMYAAFIIDKNEVIDSLDRSIGEAMAVAKEHSGENISIPKNAIVGVAGELVQGVAILVNADRENPDSEITKKEVDELIAKVKKHTFESTKDDIAQELGITIAQLEEIDTSINSVFIDGARVTDPLGYTGSEIIYRVFSSFAPKIHIESIKKVVASVGLKVEKIVVEPYAISLGLQNMRAPENSGIIIDIGGGTTDVALVKNGDIIGTKMFAIGGRVFTKRIEKEFGVDYEQAEQKKLDYTDNKLAKVERDKIHEVFERDVKVWLSGVQLALEDFEDVSEYPSEIWLCGGGALLPEIQEGLISHPWMQELNFKKFPKIRFIFPNNIKNITDKTKMATMPMDVAPLALARMILENNN